MLPVIATPLTPFLRHLEIFELLDDDALYEVLRRCRPFARNAGETLFNEGDPGDGMYIIERGELVVTTTATTGERVVLAELSNGALLGELSLASGQPRSATVEAMSATEGWWLSRRAFDELRSASPRAAYAMLHYVARTLEERRRTAEQRLRSLIAKADRTELLAAPSALELIGILRKA